MLREDGLRVSDIIIPNVSKYDIKVGDACDTPRVVVGEQALARTGLTTLLSNVLQLSTLHVGISGIWNPYVIWYFNPFADKYMFTKPSPVHPNILEPTQERALIEYILLHEYFDEGVLIEGLKNYMYQHKDDVSALYEMATNFHLGNDYVDYWINEALNDFDD